MTRYPGSRHPTARSLGTVGAISLAEARDTAREWLGQIRKGVDPQAQALERQGQTFTAIAEGYFTRKAKDLRSKGKMEAALVRLVYPSLVTAPSTASPVATWYGSSTPSRMTTVLRWRMRCWASSVASFTGTPPVQTVSVLRL